MENFSPVVQISPATLDISKHISSIVPMATAYILAFSLIFFEVSGCFPRHSLLRGQRISRFSFVEWLLLNSNVEVDSLKKIESTLSHFGNESGIVKATGLPFRNEWVQKYVVKDNLITEMEEYNIQVNKQ